MANLFTPYDLADTPLKNRIVMAPMTRARASHDVADERVALYYAQRATAGLIVSEGTPISREGQGYLFNPGIFTREQIEGWRLTTESVHAVGSAIFAQLWHVGRVSHPSIQDGELPVSASTRRAEGAKAYGIDSSGLPGLVDPPAPRALATIEVERVVSDFAQAAHNAIEAGFDGVEIHGANGYLHEQFLNPEVNDRTDRYSADILENRLRFTLEVVDAVIACVGARRVGIRLSPYGQLFDMPLYPQIDETYEALAVALSGRDIAYVHLMNQAGFARVDNQAQGADAAGFHGLLRTMKSRLSRTSLILAGGMTRERAQDMMNEGLIDLAAFGAPYISNPDLVARLQNGWPLAEPDRKTFYGGDAQGYVDYAPYQAQ